MEIPETRYAKSGDVSIAYQVVGEGPFDVVLVPAISHIELMWSMANYQGEIPRRLASFARLIVFDRRGMGMSDRVVGESLETRMDDVRAVMDAAGSTRAALFGFLDGGAMSALFAATYPERTSALALLSSTPRQMGRRLSVRFERRAMASLRGGGDELLLRLSRRSGRRCSRAARKRAERRGCACGRRLPPSRLC